MRRCDNQLMLMPQALKLKYCLISVKLPVLSTCCGQSDDRTFTAEQEQSDDRRGKPVCKNQIWRKRRSECTLGDGWPATHTHVKDSPWRHMISGDIISNGVKSLDSRGPEGKTRMLSPGPATR